MDAGGREADRTTPGEGVPTDRRPPGNPTTTRRHVLCVNAGSSSLKLAQYSLGGGQEESRIEGIA